MTLEGLPELGTVGILTFLLVELGKWIFPSVFQAERNVFMSIVFAVLVNGLHVYLTGGDVWNSIPAAAAVGLAVSGLYRGISLASKRGLEVEEDIPYGQTSAVSDGEIQVGQDGMKIVRGFGKR